MKVTSTEELVLWAAKRAALDVSRLTYKLRSPLGTKVKIDSNSRKIEMASKLASCYLIDKDQSLCAAKLATLDYMQMGAYSHFTGT